MASAAFSIDPGTGSYGSSLVAQDVSSAGATVNCKIDSISGVRSYSWEIIGTHSDAAAKPTIALSGSPSGQIASFAVPAGAGQAHGVKLTINGGPTKANGYDQSLVKTCAVYVLDANGNRPGFVGETFERNSTHGIVPTFNQLLTGLAGIVASSSIVTDADAGRTLALTDANKYVRMTNATPTVTVPPNTDVPFPIGTQIVVVGTQGSFTITEGSGVTVNVPPSRSLASFEAFSSVLLKQVAADEWDAIGDLALA